MKSKKNFFQTRIELEKLKKDDYKNYVKAIISIEKNIENEKILDYFFEKFIINKKINLLNNEFDLKEETNLDLKIQEISKLKFKIEEKELDHLYADSFEQATQITKEIENLKKQLKNLINSKEN
jgi:single-strand binding family protein